MLWIGAAFGLPFALHAVQRYRSKWREVEELKAALDICKDEHQAERRGRIRAEQDLREIRLRQSSSPSAVEAGEAHDKFLVDAIGVVKSCFSQRNGTPRQPLLVPSALAKVTLAPGIPRDALDGLSQYSHCWVLYIFHKNTDLHQARDASVNPNPHTRGFKAKIAVPRLNGKKMGVFATRSPHRPAPIGLSVAKIESVENGVVILSGVDIVNGSPVLDIKPYVPFCDSIHTARAPPWVDIIAKDSMEPLMVREIKIPDRANREIEECWQAVAAKSLYSDKSDFLGLVHEVLGRDIRSVHQRGVVENKTDMGELRRRIYHVVLEGIDISYEFTEDNVVMVGGGELSSGVG
ncbi:hypothetical protein BSKO_12297 [Bryopsis sp. KO-2023]|nr:hypothetical protein BSKO_12297 [Bryopsis sp. KO-2023]